jgi:iron complex transport system substrate-binding protein
MCSDEYLLLLARPREIASVSRLSRDPADSSLWQVGRRFPGNRGTLESALETRPNLLITMGGGGRATSMIARKIGLRTLDLPFPSNIADVARNMSLVARALGDEARADPWKAQLGRLRANGRPARDAIFLGSGGNSIAAQSVEAEWMGLAGLKQRSLPGSRATLELLATRPPEVLLRSAYRRTERSLGQSWLNHPLANPKTSKMITVDGRPWTCAGPLMLREVERLRSRS